MRIIITALQLDSIEEIKNEINLREQLRETMVGKLYPSIIQREIQKLWVRISEIEIQQLLEKRENEPKIFPTCTICSDDETEIVEPKTSIIVLDLNKLRYISEQIEKPNFKVLGFYINGYWNVFVYSTEFEQYLSKHEIKFYCQTDMERYKSEYPSKN